MTNAIQTWLEQVATRPAVMACGLRAPGIHVKSCRPNLSETQVTQAMQTLIEAMHVLLQSQIVAPRLRWKFEGGLIFCATGSRGVMAALMVDKEAANDPEIERLLSECPVFSAGQPK